MIHRHVFASDFTPQQGWLLVRWCFAHGADEFSLSFDGYGGVPAPFCDHLQLSLHPFDLGTASRQTLTGPWESGQSRSVNRWRLNDASLEVLQASLPDGVFADPSYAKQGWVEDPTFYRAGRLLLGIVNHEREGVLWLTPTEVSELAAAGFPTRDEPVWL